MQKTSPTQQDSTSSTVPTQRQDSKPPSSLERMLSVLDLFAEDATVWSVEGICDAMEFTRSTAYRYTKELADAGLLFQVAPGRYTLGARIIQWDRQLRLSDPLVRAAKQLEPELDVSTREAWLICGLFKEQVICVEEFGGFGRQVSYSRGTPRPLLKGATSKAILAFLPNRQLMQIFVNYSEEIKRTNLGSDWDEFKKSLRRIRQKGFAVTKAEVDKGVFGIAAPIFNPDKKVIGSLSIVQPIEYYDETAVDAGAERIIGLAYRISHEYERLVR
ncbi:IclR family transcriptional regulator [Nitrincola sp.]|uniref:IclR family transcriptional regulator n=1 Tax=Nitrincola sp. TaxID=1926584 RepID=UPI003A920697